MKKRIVLLTLCCVSLLCIGYPLSKKISSPSKDKTVQVSETDNTKTSAVNHTQKDTPKSSVSKDKILLSPRQHQNPQILLILQKPIIP